MTTQQARRRYMKIFIPSMIGYIAGVFANKFLIDETVAPGLGTYVLALIPALFVFAWVWGHARYILEVDEFVRMLQIKSVLYGLIVLMALTTAWGCLEFFAQAPAIPIFYVLPGFYLCYGIAALIIGKRNDAMCEML